MRSAALGKEDIAALLIDEGADKGLVNHDHLTAKDLAKRADYNNIVSMLKNRAAKK